ncbi:ribosomal protein L31 [Methylobacterium aerolatum]|uniref:50S ribosomal protein L31 n=1 Tax=Methylobacterium aerolatum TaxID=418708 RepID=A0ABU0HWL7_9HYPH|nr:ribosomal protein L31 [Methylobacterium aerolatum]GJD35865.1 hypothetical protein FMGBMHLM_2778 [Methylobacterium aerolatum]
MAKTPAKSPSNTSQNSPANSASIKVAKVARTPTEHPDYHFIRVVMTDGAEYKTRSTWGKEGDTLNLDIDPLTHPAWTGGEQKMLDRGGRVSRFTSRFGNLGGKR